MRGPPEINFGCTKCGPGTQQGRKGSLPGSDSKPQRGRRREGNLLAQRVSEPFLPTDQGAGLGFRSVTQGLACPGVKEPGG